MIKRWGIDRIVGGHNMKRILLLSIIILLCRCGTEFEPKLIGWTAKTDIFRPIIYLSIDGRLKKLELPGSDSISYHDAQWTKYQNHLLLTQSTKRNNCYEYQIISIDTSGTVMDTIFTFPLKTAIDFKLAPNDSLLILKTCYWNCGDWTKDHNFNYRFSFYNRFSKKALLDTIKVGNANNISFNETVWSPDSRKVIIEEWIGSNREAFTFDLVTKDTSSSTQVVILFGRHLIKTWLPISRNIQYIQKILPQARSN